MLSDNEGTATSFFRPNSLRAIIFISDEEDQSQTIPLVPPAGYNPWTGYDCDAAGITALNGGLPAGVCCTNGSCLYGTGGTLDCPSKTVDGYTYKVSTCAPADQLITIDSAKSQLDEFFTVLDASDGTKPNYFIVSIVANTATTIQNFQTARNADDTAAHAIKMVNTDRADRYIALGNSVGNGSLVMDIGAADYTPILNAIGDSIVAKEGTFHIARAPTSVEAMVVKINHADGSSTSLTTSQFTVDDLARTLTITDMSVIFGFKAGDQILINYEPKTVY
jgi:hypothetical protein